MRLGAAGRRGQLRRGFHNTARPAHSEGFNSMKTVTLPLTGRCQCGALAYSAAQAPIMLYACHCTDCQKQSGGAFVLSATIPEPSLTFSRGRPARATWSSEAGNQRFGLFCGECGSRIANGSTPSIGFLSLRAGTLDDTSWVRPAGHIWMRSAQPWFRAAEGDLLFDHQPEDYQSLIERFAGLQRFTSQGTA